jgi:hypothetical protein
VNGISSDGLANNIIPAMQGFFLHVSDGDYPVASTLVFTNGVRVNNLSPLFHKKKSGESTPLLRIKARNCVKGSAGDPVVICFSDNSTMMFDAFSDALKLMNTDVLEPSLYALTHDSARLSINSIPYPDDSITEIPLGLRTMWEGRLNFSIETVQNIPPGLFIYFCDKKTGVKQNIALHPDYQISLIPGDYENRFSIIFSKKDLRYQPESSDPFYIYSFRNRLYIYSKPDEGVQAELTIYNLIGQRLIRKSLTVSGYTEMDLSYPTGIYIVSLKTGETIQNKKVYILNQ